MTVPDDSEWTEFAILIKDHESYSPDKVRVKCGDKLVKEMNLPRTPTQWLTLMTSAEAQAVGATAAVRTLRFEIATCHSSGCDTRVTSVRVIGFPRGTPIYG